MIKIQYIKEKLKARLGEFWWYTLILFVVQRMVDVINMVAGLYIVPKYIPMEELGAVLPLTKVGGLLMLPISILVIPYRKFLNKFAVNDEWGKVKQLILDVFAVSAVLIVGAVFYARFFMPFIFERMRVLDGRLGILVLLSGITAAVVPIFSTVLEALKQFRLISVTGILCAPTRLVVMLIAMPIRGLSGYFAGQIAADFLNIALSFKKIGSLLSSSIKRMPYLKSDGKNILRYLIPVTIVSVLGTLITVTEAFVIRHRLPDIESAAYYMISRFAEIGNYFGNTIVFVLFPLVSERHERGKSALRILAQASGAITVVGLLLSGGLYLFGEALLSMTSAWAPFCPYVPQMALLSIIICLRSLAHCYMTHEMACNRFGCIYFGCGVYLIESVLLYSLTGYTFFKPYLSETIMKAISDFNPARLDFVLEVMLISSFLILLPYVVKHFLDWRGVRKLIREPTVQ